MSRIRLLHPKATEAAPRIEFLRKAGHEVHYDDKPVMGAIRASPPDVIVIDLSRAPSFGREAAVYLRGTKASRHIPIVFAGGEAEKVAQIRKLIPDASYTTWDKIITVLKRALAAAPANPVVPPQMMDRYGSRPVAQKLGIKPDALVTVIDPPRNYESLLGTLPDGVQFSENQRQPGSITLWFVHDAVGYQAGVGKRRGLAKQSRLWVVWPKGEAGKRTGINQYLIRKAALDAGLVDYKICAVDDHWSAMLFAAAKGT
jgi:hypothetical protein